jgi:hypothetical protein
MEKDALLRKTVETLSPFETAHLMQFLRNLTVRDAMTNPWIVGIFVVVAFYAVVVRSKFVLCALFTAVSLLLLIRYTMPAEGDSLTLTSTLPFAFGGIAIGAILIYLVFIKTE